MRMLSIAIVTAASFAVFAAPAVAETKSKKLNASRAQVESACDANGGFAWGTGAGKARPRANRGVISNIAGK